MSASQPDPVRITKRVVVRARRGHRELRRDVARFLGEGEPFFVTGYGKRVSKLVSLIRAEYPEVPVHVFDPHDQLPKQPRLAVFGVGPQAAAAYIDVVEHDGEWVAEASITLTDEAPQAPLVILADTELGQVLAKYR